MIAGGKQMDWAGILAYITGVVTQREDKNVGGRCVDLGRLLNFILDIQKIVARNAPGTIGCTLHFFMLSLTNRPGTSIRIGVSFPAQ